MADISIACNLSAFTPEQRQRYTALAQQLAHTVQDVQELADGYAFRYATDDSTWMMVAEYVNLEQRCCPFFVFTLTLDENKIVSLRLTGRNGVKAFLAAQLSGAATTAINGAAV